MSTSQEIRKRLANRDRFSLAEMRRWMADRGDLESWCAVYDVLDSGSMLIQPEPGMDEVCDFVSRYLLRCIHENIKNDRGDVPTGSEAAHDLAGCFKLWASKLPETHAILVIAARKVTDAYLAADDAERDRILNGMLEHALEAKALRPYFDGWMADPVLGEPWQSAMEWAVAHGDPANG